MAMTNAEMVEKQGRRQKGCVARVLGTLSRQPGITCVQLGCFVRAKRWASCPSRQATAFVAGEGGGPGNKSCRELCAS